ncbi:MAG: c-type cytochrome [Gallionella sp.]
MKVSYLVALMLFLGASSNALAASNGEALFKESNCNMCHAVDSHSLGPSLKEVAAKYAGIDGAVTQLQAKVRKGGKGSFGSMPMPATPKSVSDDSIRAIVHWILSLK